MGALTDKPLNADAQLCLRHSRPNMTIAFITSGLDLGIDIFHAEIGAHGFPMPNFLLVTFPKSAQHIDISQISHTCAAADVPITGYSHA
jgi:hypothetical protein